MTGPGSTASHWDAVYGGRPVAELSWTRADAGMSAELVDPLLAEHPGPVVDVGGGAGVLIDHLLAAGHRDLTVLDASATALRIARERLRAAGNDDDAVGWVVTDVRTWTPDRLYRLWHDRAVFHFLTEPADRAAYRRTAARALAADGHLVVGTFATDGPDRCSGVPVCRYSADDLAAEFAPDFTTVAVHSEYHHTPRDVDQPFTWIVMRRATTSRRAGSRGEFELRAQGGRESRRNAPRGSSPSRSRSRSR